MSVTLISLAIYFLFLLGFSIYSSFCVYYLWHFSYAGEARKIVVIGYSLISGAIIIFTLLIVFGSVI